VADPFMFAIVMKHIR